MNLLVSCIKMLQKTQASLNTCNRGTIKTVLAATNKQQKHKGDDMLTLAE